MIEHARSPEAQSPARDFRPRPMRLSILTAALQELTPRNRRDADPDLAIEEWLEFARELRCPNIELSAALADGAPSDAAAGGKLPAYHHAAFGEIDLFAELMLLPRRLLNGGSDEFGTDVTFAKLAFVHSAHPSDGTLVALDRTSTTSDR